MENFQKHWDIKHVTTTKKEESIWYQTQITITQSFLQNSFGYRNKKTQILTNKPVYLGLSILELSKTITYELGMIM